jgi:hypothetical protein
MRFDAGEKERTMILDGYEPRGGKHPETAALKDVLAYHGVRAPHTGQPFSEEMLLGIGGGLGIGYILWEFKEPAIKALVLGFRNNWQYPVKFMRNLCDRMGVTLSVKETSGKKAAAAHLREALENGRPAIAWVDLARLPYMLLPESWSGHWGHVVGVYGIDEERDVVLVDDRSTEPFTVPTAAFAAARAGIPSYRNRLMTVEPPAEINVEHAILAGIRDCGDHLSRPSESFSLPAIRKWARLIMDAKNKKGWLRVFEDRKGLFSTLRSIFENAHPIGPGGGSLRDMVADFLDEASPVVKMSELKDVADQYRAIAAQWVKLVESALPSSIGPFERTKRLLIKKHELLMTVGQDGLDAMQKVTDELSSIQSELNRHFPMRDSEVEGLFAELQAQLFDIYQAEKDANAALKAAIG